MTDRSNTNANERAAEICRQMRELRSSLGDDVEEMVESARTLTDWRHYVKSYPWLCMASAGAIGFLVVPKRVEMIQPTAEALEKLAKQHKLVINSDAKAEARSGLSGVVLGLVANAVLKAATGYVGKNPDKLFRGIVGTYGRLKDRATAEKDPKHEKSTR